MDAIRPLTLLISLVVFYLFPLVGVGFVIYFAWSALEALQSIDRNLADLANNVRNQRSNSGVL